MSRWLAVLALFAVAAPAAAQRDSGALRLRLTLQEGAHVGRRAPPILLPYATRDSAGPVTQPFDLSKELGHVVVAIFYPGDASAGAADAWRAIARHEGTPPPRVVVAGIAPDSIAAHVRFARELDLPFKLLSDQNLAVARQYGAAQGRTIQSEVVVIGRDGVVRYVGAGFDPRDPAAWRAVDAAVHAALATP